MKKLTDTWDQKQALVSDSLARHQPHLLIPSTWTINQPNFLFCKYNNWKRLITLKAPFKENSVVTRGHVNTKRLPKYTTSITDIETAKSLIGSYTTVNAINLPGRVPGHKSSTVSLFQTDCNKQFVQQQYCIACEVANQSKASCWVFWRM